MAVKSTVTCDVCGKEKEATNHWFMVNITSGKGWILPSFHVFLWDRSLNENDFKHVCGQGCLVKLLNQWVG